LELEEILMTHIFQENYLQRSLSLLCASYIGGDDFFPKFRSLAIQFPGVDDVVVLAAGEEDSQHHPGNMFASAQIQVMGRIVGDLRVYIRLSAFAESSPMPVTRFLAQQLSLALQSAAIHSSHSALQSQLNELEEKVTEHKLVERARGWIESHRLIPAGEGTRLLKKVSHQSGRRVQEVAKGIVAAAGKKTHPLTWKAG
jgi:hypothetical protein